MLEAFEAYLREQLGQGHVWVRSGGTRGYVFTDKQPESMAAGHLYEFTFRNPMASRSFELTTRKPHGLGNYPVPILINGRYVTCANGNYLIKLGSVFSFFLDC
ncbi:MAG TPA: hypothetical protein VH274_00365 [Mycobacteriales bacterium]|jgi:hypothetical protein|nr:hypothetical protein [Mycobacteriales bacterium]